MPLIKLAHDPNNEGKNITTCGLIVKIQRMATKKGSPMVFAKIEDLNDNIEVLVFSDVLEKDESVWQEGNAVQVTGRISSKNGEAKIICNEAKKLAL